MEGGWLTAMKYEDELRDMLKERTGGNKEKARFARAILPCTAAWASRQITIVDISPKATETAHGRQHLILSTRVFSPHGRFHLFIRLSRDIKQSGGVAVTSGGGDTCLNNFRSPEASPCAPSP